MRKSMPARCGNAGAPTRLAGWGRIIGVAGALLLPGGCIPLAELAEPVAKPEMVGPTAPVPLPAAVVPGVADVIPHEAPRSDPGVTP